MPPEEELERVRGDCRRTAVQGLRSRQFNYYTDQYRSKMQAVSGANADWRMAKMPAGGTRGQPVPAPEMEAGLQVQTPAPVDYLPANVIRNICKEKS